MIPPLTFVKVVDEQPIDVTVREHGRIMEHAHQAMAAKWATDMLPRHFTPAARQLYGYKPRKKSTIIQKRKAAQRGKAEMGGEVDDVWSGLSMRSALARQEIRVNSKRALVVMFVPRYFYAYKPNTPNKAAEMTADAPIEAPTIEQAGSEGYDRGLAIVTAGRTKTTTITG